MLYPIYVNFRWNISS